MRPEKARGLSAAVREWERVTNYINEGRGERYTNEGRGGGQKAYARQIPGAVKNRHFQLPFFNY